MMPAELACDDVIRIRIDTGWAVQDFLDQLAVQAAEGETRAPANPANRAVFRELAPFRLVEYAYVDDSLESIDSVHIGFPDGSIYSVSDEIPEALVDDLVRGAPASLPPLYLYILPGAPCAADAIGHFLAALASHLGKPLVGVFRAEDGTMAARIHDGGETLSADSRARLAEAAAKSLGEGARHLTRQQVLDGYAARAQSPDGRAWAQISYNFTRHVVEFASAADRDDFIEWSHVLCAWGQARWADLGFTEVLRPAEVAPAPIGEVTAVPLLPPSKALDGRPWRAFGGRDAATAQHFPQSGAAVNGQALADSMVLAREYWDYCTATIDAAQAVSA